MKENWRKWRERKKHTQSRVQLMFKRARVSALLFEFLQQAEDASSSFALCECEGTTRKYTFSVDMCAKKDTTQSPYIIVCNNSWLPFSLCVRVRDCAVCIREKKYELNFNFNFNSFRSIQYEQPFYFNFSKAHGANVHALMNCSIYRFSSYSVMAWLDGCGSAASASANDDDGNDNDNDLCAGV